MNVPSVTLLIPCYNESKRIDRMFRGIDEFVAHWPGDSEIIIVDDGSTDNTKSCLEQQAVNKNLLLQHKVKCIHQVNTGKGGALKKGVPVARMDYILTLDADMATSPLQLTEWLNQRGQFTTNELLIGSRELPDSVIAENPFRHWVGIIFNTLIRSLVKLPFRDTQCGFKLYPRAIAVELFQELKTDGWAHDVELLLLATEKKYSVVEMPLRWSAIEGSKINVLTDSWIMLLDVIHIRLRHRTRKRN